MARSALIVTRNFPPLVGGMERLLWHVYKSLQDDYLCHLIGPKGCASSLNSKALLRECPRSAPRFLVCASYNAWRATRSHKFTVCLAGNGLTAPIAVLLAARRGMRSVVLVHGLDLIVPHLVYQSLFVPSLRRADRIIANSTNTARLATEKGVDPSRIVILNPGTELPGLVPERANEFRARVGLQSQPIILFVGRLVPRKGLLEFLERGFPLIADRLPSVHFFIIGTEPKHAIRRRSGIFHQAQAQCKAHSWAGRVRFMGEVDDDTLGAAYQAATLLVFPIKRVSDDVEGFGMVAVEAAAHGLPTLAFAVDGVTDAIKPGISGELVRPDDYHAFAESAVAILQGNTPITRETCRRHAEQFAWPRYGERLRQILAEVH